MTNMILKQHILQRFGAMKAQVVNIKDSLDALRKFDIDTGVVNINSRVDKVCLALSFATAQTWQNAVWLDQAHTGLRQSNAVAIPIRKLPAHKIWIVKDRVKPS